MKHLTILVFTFLFCSQLQAQFKELPANSTTSISVKDLDHPVKPDNVTPVSGKSAASVDYTTFSNQALQSIKDEVNVEFWDHGRPIAITRTKLEKSNISVEGQSLNFINEMSEILQLENGAEEFVLSKATKDEINMDHMSYSQYYKGIRVLNADLIIHAKNDVVTFANGQTFPTPELSSTTPILSEMDIKDIITNEIPLKTLTPTQKRFIKEQWKSELVVYHLDGKVDQERLAYFIEYRPNVADRYFYIMDANNGAVLSKYSGVCQFHGADKNHVCDHNSVFMPPTTANAQDLFGVNNLINTFEQNGTYYMVDASRPMYQPAADIFDASGIIVTLDAQNTSPENNNFSYTEVSSSNNTWNDPTTVSAHVNSGKAFEYFAEKFGRNSINGMGGDVISLVHVADENGNGMDNAFWNGAAMWYGDGNQAFNSLARGLDVAGHEISHGVVQSTANLTYQGESGALNESFADVFGAMIDRDDWRMGEDVVKLSAFPSGALRSLEDPHNGAAQGDYGGGFQPKHVNEKFTGSQDNGGVHINSGIPNHAYYLFATEIGKDKAEKVWYRALANYLTASSQFVDLRVATVKAAEDLYGTTEVNALKSALDQVGILGGEGGNYEEDLNINAGEDFVLMTDINKQDIYIYDLQNNPVKISDKDPISKPSITDNGEEIVFIATDNKMHYIKLTWDGNTITNAAESVLQSQEVWRNVVISKDGLRLAGLFDNVGTDLENTLWVYDFDIATPNEYQLKNPTTSNEGNTTDDVRYADALEFDISGEWVMYDAFNEISGANNSKIEYWDISFIKVWNSTVGVWSLGTEVNKLFSSLPEGVSVGNPTFSKNSPYIIAYEYIDDSGFEMRGLNLETSDTGVLKEQGGIGYPSYSRTDEFVIYDNLTIAQQPGLDVSAVDSEKLNGSGHSLLRENFRWGVWFGNGDRLTSVDQIDHLEGIKIMPNPTTGFAQMEVESELRGEMQIAIYNVLGKKVYGNRYDLQVGRNIIDIHLSSLVSSGQYFVKIQSEEKSGSLVLQVIR